MVELVLKWVSDTADLNPDFEINYIAGEPTSGDTLTLSIYTNEGLTILHDSDVDTLDSTKIAAGTITLSSIITLSAGVQYWAVATMVRGADPTVTSNTVTRTMV